ncbi:MAG: YceI family protein [Bacteroidota bacterium]
MASLKNLFKTQLFIFSIILPGIFAFTLWNTWSISNDYVVRFSGSGAEGTFRGLHGTIVFDPSAPEQAKFDVSVDATTIDTGNKTKDKHARGDNWFDVEKYPEIKFRSSRITKADEQYQMTGILTLHGTEKEIIFPFTFTESGSSGVFEGSFTVDREEFGIEGPFIGFLVGDDFEVSLKVPVQSP